MEAASFWSIHPVWKLARDEEQIVKYYTGESPACSFYIRTIMFPSHKGHLSERRVKVKVKEEYGMRKKVVKSPRVLIHLNEIVLYILSQS